MKQNLFYSLENKDEIVEVCKALSSPTRLEILEFLSKEPAIISDVATKFDIPLSSAALYVKNLESAGLISVQPIPGSKGSQKLCGVLVNSVQIDMFNFTQSYGTEVLYKESMPVGCYFDYKATPSCGMVSETFDLGFEDNIAIFTSPNRFKAQLIWLSTGFLEYRFSNSFIKSNNAGRIKFSFEICSEALGHNNQWQSDVTVSINNKEIGIVHCDGDYGDRQGRLNPDWWNPTSTQYGLLRTVELTEKGCFIDGNLISNETITSLGIADGDFVKFKLEVKEDANYAGGFNLFGEKFGDHPQSLQMEIYKE